MDTHERLVAKVAGEQDDVLSTLSLVARNDEVAERMWSQLVDLLVESMFLDLRSQLVAGTIDREGYVAELSELATRCRDSGLLPLPTSGS
jgi:hypothetical protein